jgi:hypothetical protein
MGPRPIGAGGVLGLEVRRVGPRSLMKMSGTGAPGLSRRRPCPHHKKRHRQTVREMEAGTRALLARSQQISHLWVPRIRVRLARVPYAGGDIFCHHRER